MHMDAISLRSEQFEISFSPEDASVQSLIDPADQYATNFVLNAQQAPELKVADSRFLGHLVFHVKQRGAAAGRTMTTGLSTDVRIVTKAEESLRVAYSGNAQHRGGLAGIAVEEVYAVGGQHAKYFDWTFTITNESKTPLEVEDLGVPLPMNSYWGMDQLSNYEQRVHRHSFVALNGSYIYWQRPSGNGNMLVMLPHKNTSLEFKQRFREGEGTFGENLPKWEGLSEFYIHSKHVAKARADQARQYLSATSLSLLPGESQTYGFRFAWAKDYQDLREVIYENAGFDIISLPGMVIPSDTAVTLAVRCLDGIDAVTGGSVDTVKLMATNTSKYEMYSLKFTSLGENQITITSGDGRAVVLQYYCIEPIETLIAKRAAFLATNQLAKTDRGYDGAFLQWDMSTEKLITWDDYPGGGWKEWMAGGSDDLGLAPAVFLSEKCLSFPIQSEVDAVDYHVDNFLLGYLLGSRDATGSRTYQVYRWYDGQDDTPKDTGIWRAYNYTHIANVAMNMYRLSKMQTVSTRRQPVEYLEIAYEVLNAMYSKIPLPNPIGDAANTLGLMGESTVPELIEYLGQEKMIEHQRKLRGYLEAKVRYYSQNDYPFASEQTIDTTGFESVYAFAKYACKDRSLVRKAQEASLACRGLQPIWYFYGSDNRMMGESYWNLGYETQLGAWQQQDFLVNEQSQEDNDFSDSMRSTYGAYLAGWANINSGQIDDRPANIGAASWLWQSEGGKPSWSFIPTLGSWWAWSGEAELGFWGALRTATVNVVQDPVVGLYAYGGDVESKANSYIISPRDGVRRRFTLFCLNNLTVHIDGARYTKAIVASDGSSIELSIEGLSECPSVAQVTVSNAPQGIYKMAAEKQDTTGMILMGGDLKGQFQLAAHSGRPLKVTIRKVMG